jgi:uncharacterized protein with beta-barrel porin domain
MNNYQEKQYRDLFNILSIKFILLFVVSFIILPPYKISFAAELANNGSITAPTTTGEGGTPAEWTTVGSPDLKSTSPETGKFTFDTPPTGPSTDGGTWLSLYSSSPSSGEGIKQLMSTVAGTTYYVSFYTGNFGVDYGPTQIRGPGYIEVYEGTSGSTGTLIHTSTLLSLSSAWSTESFSFTASANNSYIYFVARYVGLPGADTVSTYLSIDGISVSDSLASISPSSQSLSAELGDAISPTSSFSETGFSGSVTYTISPSLPTGLAMDGTTGVISGNPTTTSSSTSYTITATGATSGVATSTITISVSDTNSPTVTFNPTNGAAGISVDTDITLTFSEAVRNLDDTALTDANVDSLVELKLNNSSGTPIAFDATINAGKTVITINPTSSFTEGTTIYVALKASSVEDSSDNATSATSITFSVGLNDPTTKADVKGTVNTMSQAAIQFVRTHILTVNNRLGWLQRNGNQNTSYQGIKVSVNGHEVGQPSRLWNQWMSNTGDDALYSNLLSLNDTFTNQSFKVAMMDAAYETLLSLVDINPTGGKFMDSYSVWTDGQISFGDSKASGQSSDLHGFNLAMGIDKLDEDNEIMGIALNYAEGDAKINSSGSKTDSQSISLSLYAQQHLTDELDVQGQLGVGLMNFDSRRIDDSQTLTGDREGKMLFAAIALTPYDALRYNNMFIKPYGRGEYSHIKLDDYAESGGSNALNYKDQHINRYMIFAGSEIYLDMNVMGGQFKPFAGFEYGLDLTGDSKVGMYYVSNSSTQYQLTQKAVARSNVMVKVGADYTALNGIISTVSFQSEEALGSGSYYTFALNITIPLN